jgi:excisionase family DNA binding protein
MSKEVSEVTALAHSIKRAAHLSGISRSKLYEFIKGGKLPIVKVGRRTLVTDDDLRALIATMRRNNQQQTGGAA